MEGYTMTSCIRSLLKNAEHLFSASNPEDIEEKARLNNSCTL